MHNRPFSNAGRAILPPEKPMPSRASDTASLLIARWGSTLFPCCDNAVKVFLAILLLSAPALHAPVMPLKLAHLTGHFARSNSHSLSSQIAGAGFSANNLNSLQPTLPAASTRSGSVETPGTFGGNNSRPDSIMENHCDVVSIVNQKITTKVIPTVKLFSGPFRGRK